jgi:hypothetical protein
MTMLPVSSLSAPRTLCIGCAEARVNHNRNQEDLWGEKIHREVAEAAPEEKPRLPTERGAGSIGELPWVEARQGLHVVQTNDRVGWDGAWPAATTAFRWSTPKKGMPATGPRRPGRRDLSVGEDRRVAYSVASWKSGRIAIE